MLFDSEDCLTFDVVHYMILFVLCLLSVVGSTCTTMYTDYRNEGSLKLLLV